MVINGMQALTDWIQPGNVGDTGGGSSNPAGQFIMTPGSPATFTANGAVAYNNGYWYRNVPGSWDTMTYFEYGFAITFPNAQDIAACQAFEFELQQNVGSTIYNMAYQFDLKGSKMVRTFDYNKTDWVATSIPVTAINLAPGVTNTIASRFLRQNGMLTHLSITLNGNEYVVNATRPATPKVESDYVHAAFQLDSTDPAMPYLVQVNNMTMTMVATGV